MELDHQIDNNSSQLPADGDGEFFLLAKA